MKYHWSRYLIWASAAMLAFATLLPWWSRNGASVGGFTGAEFGYPGIPVLVVAMGMGLGAASRHAFAKRVLWASIAFGWIITLGHLWRGYKLHAMGVGLFVLLVAMALATFAAVKHYRHTSS